VALKIWEFVSIALSALAGGMYWGPWLALSRSMRTFKPEVFLDIVDRMNRNMESVMTVLTPASLLSIAPVLFFSYNAQPMTFYLTLAGFALFVVALLVTVIVEVPIVKQIVTWTVGTLPDDWQQVRDRWGAFHIVRVGAGMAGLVLLVAGAIF
jgi:anthrone oxygenase-like protein